MTENHQAQYRIYYEDTDAGGVVYYANYLKFAERARTEFLRDFDVNQRELAEKEKILFVVKNVNMDILKPAKLDDIINIKSKVVKKFGASFVMEQEIYIKKGLEKTNICNINIKLVAVNDKFKPIRLAKFLDKMLLC